MSALWINHWLLVITIMVMGIMGNMVAVVIMITEMVMLVVVMMSDEMMVLVVIITVM